jgi:hypothetical protein
VTIVAGQDRPESTGQYEPFRSHTSTQVEPDSKRPDRPPDQICGSSLALVKFIVRCLGPVRSAKINGRLISVSRAEIVRLFGLLLC